MIKSDNKIKSVNWKILLRDVLVLVAIYFAIDTWQSRNMLDIDSLIEFDGQILTSLNKQSKDLIEANKPTLIYFFAPWCTVCSLSIGNLEYLETDKVNIVRVALDYSNAAEVQKFADDHNISAQILLGNEALKKQFKIQGYPTYYIMDQQQKVLAKSYGYSTAMGLKIRQFFSG